MTSILFFTTSARDTKFLNDEIKRNGGFKNASSLEPLKKEYNLTPMASLTDISDETLKFFYKDFLEFYREKHYFYDVSNDDEMTYFLIHTAGKLLKTAFPLMLKSLLSGGARKLPKERKFNDRMLKLRISQNNTENTSKCETNILLQWLFKPFSLYS